MSEMVSERKTPKTDIFHSILGGGIVLASVPNVEEAVTDAEGSHSFHVKGVVETCFCDDYGPYGLASIYQFAVILHQHIFDNPKKRIIFMVEDHQRDITNGVFLLGCYMIIIRGMDVEEILCEFDSMEMILGSYSDASFDESDFRLQVVDCWNGIRQAKQIGWIDAFDIEEYVHYDNPLEGDLHTIIPGKLIAFKGPKSVGGDQMYEDLNGQRTFAPAFFIEPFEDMGVHTVIRLNEREYADAEFEENGVRCVSLEFDSSIPPPDVVIAFLYTMRAARGAVAVHCRSGLARTGTLCALHLMLSHGFSAREAIAWMRVTRPGSIVGEQQHHLCAVEAMLAILLHDRQGPAALPPLWDSAAGAPPSAESNPPPPAERWKGVAEPGGQPRRIAFVAEHVHIAELAFEHRRGSRKAVLPECRRQHTGFRGTPQMQALHIAAARLREFEQPAAER